MTGLLFSESYPPAPSSGKNSQPPKQESKSKQTEAPNYQRGTKASPIFIETLERQVDRDEKINERQYRDKETAISNRNNIFTAGLLLVAIGQIFLFYWQLKLMHKSLTDTEKAANAAQKSADVAEKTVETMTDTAKRQLRAYVFPKHDKPLSYNSEGHLTSTIIINLNVA